MLRAVPAAHAHPRLLHPHAVAVPAGPHHALRTLLHASVPAAHPRLLRASVRAGRHHALRTLLHASVALLLHAVPAHRRRRRLLLHAAVPLLRPRAARSRARV